MRFAQEQVVDCRTVHADCLAHLLCEVLRPAAAAVLLPCSALQGLTAGLRWAAEELLTAAPGYATSQQAHILFTSLLKALYSIHAVL